MIVTLLLQGPVTRVTFAGNIAKGKQPDSKKILANNFLQILHQLGKRAQSLLKPNNNKTRLTTAKLFVGVEVWEATLFPFLCKIASEREKKGKTSTFFFLDMTALLFLLNKDFLEVVWPGREVRANIICDAEYPVTW
jgi:hypothetical protein